MAISFLQFKKEYDCVDRAFLEDTMLRVGLLESWIRGVVAFYISAHSQVLLARG